MLKICVISGGSGSENLQKGLNELFGYGNYKLNIIINAYDNGKSTGVCRRAYSNKILGPSDLRKNQLVNFKLKYNSNLLDKNSEHSKLLNLMETRINCLNLTDFKEKSLQIIECSDIEKNIKQLFLNLTKKFCKRKKQLENESFDNFCISNIFYAELANNKNLSYAGKVMAEILNIDNNVLLISDKSLMLKAITESGKIIEDEGNIVDYNNSNDKIQDILLLEPKTNKEFIPSVSKLCSQIILNSDVIIFSSGTQFSSLIPTYMHKNFNKIIQKSKAKKYLIMNNIQDKDMKGFSSLDILNKVNEFVDLNDFIIITNKNADEVMQCSGKYKNLTGILSDNKNDKKHNGLKLAQIIFKDYFKINSMKKIISDFDGTLFSNFQSSKISQENLELAKQLNVIIASGNDSSHIMNFIPTNFSNKIYCSYGASIIVNNSILTEDLNYDEDLVNKLKLIYPKEFIKIVGAVIHLKPINEREKEIKKLKYIIGKNNYMLIAGKTSIDIINKKYSKNNIIIKESDYDSCYFIGNELNYGNEQNIKKYLTHYYNVNDIFETNNILKIFAKEIL